MTLDISHQRLKVFPKMPKEKYLALKIFKCDHNYLSKLPILPPTLEELYCGQNIGLRIPPLPSTLKIFDCQFCDLTKLNDLPLGLKELACDQNKLDYISSFPSSLIRISCSYNDLTELPTLPDNLEDLDISVNEISSLQKLPKTLKSLDISRNPITEMPILPWGLEILSYSDTEINDFGIFLTADQIKLVQYNKKATEYGLPSVTSLPSEQDYNRVVYHSSKNDARRVTDLGIALRNSGLPPYLVAQISAYDAARENGYDGPAISAFDVYQMQLHLDPIMVSNNSIFGNPEKVPYYSMSKKR